MLNLLRSAVRRIALSTGRLEGIYKRFCRPNGDEYAAYLKLHGSLHSMGEYCSILPETFISDPAYVRLGDNVRLSTCALIGHDGSIAMINHRFNLRVDRVGKIDIRDNVFIGYGAIVMPGVTIGPDAIVAAGAVVTRDVGENQVVAGVPAKPIGKLDDLARRLEKQTDELPWHELIAARAGHFDARIEPQLVAARVRHFYGQVRHA